MSAAGIVRAAAGFASGSGRGPIASPSRGRGRAVPPPVEAWAPGGWLGPIDYSQVQPEGFFPTLPLPQPDFQGQRGSPKLSYQAGYYRPGNPRNYTPNTVPRDNYSAPTTFNQSVNRTVGGESPAGHDGIPVNARWHDQDTFYLWANSERERYPNEGRGYRRLRPQDQGRNVRRYGKQATMTAPHQNELTVKPDPSSYGATTSPLLSAFQESSF